MQDPTDDVLMHLLEKGEVRRATEIADDSHPPLSQQIVRGWACMGAGDLAQASAVLRACVTALEARDEPVRQAHAVLALGVARTMDGDLDAGAALLDRALSLHTAGWPRAQALRYLALGLELRGAWESAMERYMAAAAVYDEIGHLFGAGNAMYGAAVARIECGDVVGAKALLETAVVTLRRAGLAPALGAAGGALATLIVAEDPARALALLDEADALCANSPGMYAADSLLRRGEVMLSLRRPEEALRVASAVLAMADVPQVERVEAAHMRVRAHLDRGEDTDAAAVIAADTGEKLPGPAWLEHLALALHVAVRLADPGAVDRALDGLDQLARTRWRRRGVGARIVQAARELKDAERMARALHLAVAFGTPVAEVTADLLWAREAGARVPLGPFWMEAPIGRGGMGEVWRAVHRDGAQVAVKLVTSGDPALFVDEVRAVARLDHRNVVRVHAVLPVDDAAAVMLKQAKGTSALVMDLAKGGALNAHPDEWSWPELRDMFLALLDGLAHAHGRGVVHLDLKPANVLLDGGPGHWVPRLTDFGLAGLIERKGGEGVFGTPAFMAPEQARNDVKLDARADLYGFGCLAWRMLTGGWVYAAPDPRAQIVMHQMKPLPPFRPIMPVPVGVAGWLAGLLAKDREERFWCAADAAEALRAVEGRTGPVAAAMGAQPATPSAETFAASWDGGADSGLEERAEDVVSTELAAHGSPTLAPPTAAPTTLMPETLTAMKRPPPLPLAITTVLPGKAGAVEADTQGPPRPEAPTIAPMPADWRQPTDPEDGVFLVGAGEGCVLWRLGRLVGRDAEQDRLWRTLAAVRADGRPRACWIVGAEGLGRTALLDWIAEEAVRTGAAFVARGDRVDQVEATARTWPRGRPGLVLLDDPDHEPAHRLIQALSDLPVMFVLTARIAPPGAGDVIGLAPLSDGALVALLDARLPLQRALALRLAARSAGSPAFAVAMLTDLVRRDALAPGPEGFLLKDREELALPEDVRGLWARRLEPLAPPGSLRRTAWELAAIMGPVVDPVAWGRACERLGIPSVGALEALAAEGWAERVGDTWRFRSSGLANALGQVDPARLRRLHGAAADVLPEGPAYARHLALAGRHQEALELLRRYAAVAINNTQVDECRTLLALWDHAADALGIAPDDGRRAAPLVVRAHLALHSDDDPYAIIDRGLQLTAGDYPVLECQLYYTRGWVLVRDGRPAEAEGCFLTAIMRAETSKLEVMGAISQFGLAEARFAMGLDAMPLVETARATLLHTSESLAFRADACAGRGLARRGLAAEARPYLEAAVVGARADGAPDVLSEALADLADLDVADGDLDGALGRMDAAVTALSATGSDKAFAVIVRRAGMLLCAGRDAEVRAALGPLRERFGRRLRPVVAAEMALIEAGLAGEAGGSTALPDEPAIRRLVAEVARRRR